MKQQTHDKLNVWRTRCFVVSSLIYSLPNLFNFSNPGWEWPFLIQRRTFPAHDDPYEICFCCCYKDAVQTYDLSFVRWPVFSLNTETVETVNLFIEVFPLVYKGYQKHKAGPLIVHRLGKKRTEQIENCEDSTQHFNTDASAFALPEKQGIDHFTVVS